MIETIAKIAVLLLGVLLLSGAGVSLAVYGSVDPCTMLAEERARRAQDAAEDALGADVEVGPSSLQDAAEQAREVAGRATGDVERAATEARMTVEGTSSGTCVRELWDTWF